MSVGSWVSRFVGLARERISGEARVEDLLVLLPGEIFDFVVAAAGVPVGGDGAWGLELGDVVGETEAQAVV